MSAQGVPHHLGVLSHFDSVVWHRDNRLTQDAEDVVTETFALGPEDAAVAERQQYLTIAVRDYLNEGGKLALTGETTAYYGQLGTSLGGIYYGLDGAPDQDCEVTADFFSDCLLLADDFTQYYLGAFTWSPRAAPESPGGTGEPITGLTRRWGTRRPTRSTRPGRSCRRAPSASGGVPQFTSAVSGVYEAARPGTSRPSRATGSPRRRTPTTPTCGSPDRRPHRGHRGAGSDAGVRAVLRHGGGYDNVIVEAHPVGTDEWTTLPEAGGLSDTTPRRSARSGSCWSCTRSSGTT